MLVIVGFVAAAIASAWTLARIFQGFSASNKYEKLKDQHVLITGGSSGIGLEVAKLVASYGAKVTIVSRSEEKLEQAKVEIQKYATSSSAQSIVTSSIDITMSDTNLMEGALKLLIDRQGPVFMLINCAGLSIPGTLETLKPSQIQLMMNLNFFGSAFVTKALLPSMKANGGGKIVFVSSLAGLVGVFGYTAYSASKFALRGFAESLSAEVSPYNITVTVSCPPDTDTPGFKEEERLKPLETTLISESAGLFNPSVVARSIIDDALRGRFLSSIGSEGFMLTNLCVGMSPSSFPELVIQVCVMGLCRVIAWGHSIHFERIIKKVAKMKDSGKKTD